MARYAVITLVSVPALSQQGVDVAEVKPGTVVNAIVLDNTSQWQAQENTIVVQSETLNIGDIYNG